MTTVVVHNILRHIRRLTSQGEGATDAELLRRFVAKHEEAAFEELLCRHGPMVLRVCRRLLSRAEDAEDVCQAAFVLLARKAASIRRPVAVAAWLYGVAYRVAQQTRGAAARRRVHEGRIAMRTVENPLDELSVREARAVLDEELTRLPEKYRAPLVLCYLEGQTRDEAARRLGWSASLVKNRLEQARDRLRQRLIRRGLTLSSTLLVSLLIENPATGTLSVVLMRSTVQAALAFTVGRGAISAPVAALVADGLRAMSGTPRTALALLLVASSLTGAALLAYHSREGPPPAAVNKTEQPAAKSVHTDRYGDPLPPGALARLGTLRFRPGEPIAHIAFSPDGKLLAVATQNTEANANLVSISLWDSATGKRLRQFGVGKRPPFVVAFSPDGKILASQDERGEVHLWDVATGKELRRITAGGLVYSVGPGPGGQIRGVGFAFSPDGKALAARGPDKAIHLWDPATGKELRKLNADPEDFSPIAFSRDGKILASSAEKIVRLWDLETGKEKTRLMGHEGLAGTPVFSADGKTFTALARTPGQIYQMTAYIWDIASAKLLRKWDLSANPVFVSCHSPDGQTLLAGGFGGDMHLYDRTTGKERRRLVTSFRGAFFAAAFSPDGKTITAGGENRVLQLWDAQTGQPLAPFAGHQGIIRSLSLSLDGKYLASLASEKEATLWDMATAKPLGTFGASKNHLSGVSFAPDGRTAAVVGEDAFVRLLEVPSGKEIRRFSAGKNGEQVVAFSPDGRIVASGSRFWSNSSQDKSIRLWETATGKLLRRIPVPLATEKPDGGILCLAFSPDGRLLASGGWGEAAHIWNVATGQLHCQLPGHEYWVSSLRFSPDGQTLAAAHWDRTKKAIRLWEVRSGKERGQLTGHTDRVGSLAFAPDGRLASAGDDKTIRIWDLDTAEQVGCFRGHDSVVGPLAFSADGKRLVSGGWDTTILVWDMTSLPPPRPAETVELSSKELDAIWADLGNTDAAKAYRAMRTLIRGRQQTVSFFTERLRSRKPVSEETITGLIADLDSERFAARTTAEAELEKLEDLAEAPLRRALRDKSSSLELRRRMERLLKRLEGPVTSGETLRRLRAIEVLEHIGGKEARQLLRTLANGAPAARLTCEAQAAFDRLDR